MEFKELLASEFTPFGTLSSHQLSALDRHYKLLVQWNRRMNLTRIEKLEDVVRLHYCESLFLAQILPPGPLRIADMGSGAGFPGFPVAVFRPDCTVDLIESHQRKAVFLREAAAGVSNIQVLAHRAESLNASYDWIISRAVVPTDVLDLKLAPNAAILMAASDLGNLRHKPSHVRDVPWGNGHVLALF